MVTSACSARGVRLRCFAQLDKINMVDAIRAQIPLDMIIPNVERLPCAPVLQQFR